MIHIDAKGVFMFFFFSPTPLSDLEPSSQHSDQCGWQRDPHPAERTLEGWSDAKLRTHDTREQAAKIEQRQSTLTELEIQFSSRKTYQDWQWEVVGGTASTKGDANDDLPPLPKASQLPINSWIARCFIINLLKLLENKKKKERQLTIIKWKGSRIATNEKFNVMNLSMRNKEKIKCRYHDFLVYIRKKKKRKISFVCFENGLGDQLRSCKPKPSKTFQIARFVGWEESGEK